MSLRLGLNNASFFLGTTPVSQMFLGTTPLLVAPGVALPSAPTNLTVVPGPQAACLTWTAASGNGNPITGYQVHYSDDDTLTWDSVATNSTATSYTLTGLTDGTAYRIRVAAVTSVGVGAATAWAGAVTPAATEVDEPPPPTNVRLTSVDVTFPIATATPWTTGDFTISWTAPPACAYTVTGYVFERQTSWKTQSATSQSYEVLDDWQAVTPDSVVGTTATFENVDFPYSEGHVRYRVAATNSIGTGAWSEPSPIYYPPWIKVHPGSNRIGFTTLYRNAGTASSKWAPATAATTFPGYAIYLVASESCTFRLTTTGLPNDAGFASVRKNGQPYYVATGATVPLNLSIPMSPGDWVQFYAYDFQAWAE